jgi:hypothetical protein
MIRQNRGVIFGSNGRAKSNKTIRAGSPAAKSQANTTSQFGRSQTHKPVFGGRARPARR